MNPCGRCGDTASDYLCLACIDDLEAAIPKGYAPDRPLGAIAQKCVELLAFPAWINNWETTFLKSIKERNPSRLSWKQQSALDKIDSKIATKLEKEHGSSSRTEA